MNEKSRSLENFIFRTLKRSGYGILSSSLALSVGCSTQNQNQQKSENGYIGKTLKESKPFVREKDKFPANAPNVVWIVLDDVGFGASSAFGGLIKTPNLDSLANNGLRYSNFHVEAYCAPTRAALLTGRNHHSVHMGLFTECAVEYPGYDGRIPFEKGMAAEVLRENGYNTFAVGKWHVTPSQDATQAGPFNRWPTGRGFDHYFGFLFGETDQYHPQLWENNSKVEPDNAKELNELLADKAISYISNQKSAAPEKPFFLYFATGATHEPHQVSKEWRDKYKGKFDSGWDKYRELVLANQKKLGLVPQNAILPHNPEDRPWDTLSADEKKLYARFFENYAGFLSYTDYEIGRVINYIKQIGQLENTAIFVLIGDNGASGEGNETGYIQGYNESINDKPSISESLKNIDKIGTDASKPHYPRTWATAANTPFRSWKGNAQAEGGTHDPLIVFYPKLIKEKGVRNQYAHVIDVLPTTIELTGSTVPETINGYKQDPIQGTSFFNSIADAKASSKHTLQYFEVAGRRAIYKDGWKAGADHKDGEDFSKDVWELYNINDDFNEIHNLADKNPDKLKELQDVFDQEAKKYNIYPLKDWKDSPWNATDNSYYGDTKKIVLYPGIAQLFGGTGPILINRSFSITADAEILSAKTEGVLFALGGSYGGLSLFVKNGKFEVAHNNSPKLVHLESKKAVPTGHIKLRFELEYKDVPKGDDIAGSESIYINGEKAGELPIKKYQANINTYDEGIDVGKDLNYPVSDRYKVPFEFTGKLNSIIIEFPDNK